MKVTIVGNGVFGNAMLHVLQKNTQEVAIANRGEKIEEAEIVVLCVPVQAIRDVLPLVTFSGEKRIIVNTAKGIEQSTNKFPYQIIEEFYGNSIEYFSLLGPSFAHEIVNDMPTLVNIGYRSESPYCTALKQLFQTDSFHIRLTEGVEVIEIASAMKNIYAIGVGLSEGLGYGENTKAKIITIAIEEMQQLFKGLHFIVDINATAGTIGDLILTCVSKESRNFQFGHYFVSYPAEEALQKVNSTVEGYNSIQSLKNLQMKAGVSLPLAEFITNLITQNNRDIKNEFDTFMKTHY